MGSLVNRALVMMAASIATGTLNAQGQQQMKQLRNLEPGDYIADAKNGGGLKKWKIGRRQALKRRAKVRARKARR